MAVPTIGRPAPEFTLPDANERPVSLVDFRGRKVVLYFYPKDNTSGCTREACAFRDEAKRLARANAVIVGVSPDGAVSHQKFIAKYGLPFALLCDEDKVVARLYGVWKEKTMYGKKKMGIERSTFLIDEQGVLVREFRKVKVDGHLDQVLAALVD
ncbi:MAG: thioredoxin-dependent thiol peroxidase [Myxococcales bacterium]|nr:thioredoxin-dependent thiol peroxidase [Myxococcales bacterium]